MFIDQHQLGCRTAGIDAQIGIAPVGVDITALYTGTGMALLEFLIILIAFKQWGKTSCLHLFTGHCLHFFQQLLIREIHSLICRIYGASKCHEIWGKLWKIRFLITQLQCFLKALLQPL